MGRKVLTEWLRRIADRYYQDPQDKTMGLLHLHGWGIWGGEAESRETEVHGATTPPWVPWACTIVSDRPKLAHAHTLDMSHRFVLLTTGAEETGTVGLIGSPGMRYNALPAYEHRRSSRFLLS